MGVRPAERALRADLDAVLTRCSREIYRILDEFGVPRVAPKEPDAAYCPPPV
jgi:hypothetical protein